MVGQPGPWLRRPWLRRPWQIVAGPAYLDCVGIYGPRGPRLLQISCRPTWASLDSFSCDKWRLGFVINRDSDLLPAEIWICYQQGFGFFTTRNFNFIPTETRICICYRQRLKFVGSGICICILSMVGAVFAPVVRDLAESRISRIFIPPAQDWHQPPTALSKRTKRLF